MQGTNALVLGAGGFIGAHTDRRLAREGCWVARVDLALPRFSATAADDFVVGDLRDPGVSARALDRPMDEVYQLAAEVGGAGFIFTCDHDLEMVSSSALIHVNVARACARAEVARVFFPSSACVYPPVNQLDPSSVTTAEESAYPAEPDSEYGWEKLFAERLWATAARGAGLDVRIARYHNVFGPEGTWRGGREKAPAALCRKVAEAPENGTVEIWGDGRQSRSFLFVDECLEGTVRLMRSECREVVNIGSSEMVTIEELARMLIRISGKSLSLRPVAGPVGVRARTSDNRRIAAALGWAPGSSLEPGLEATYRWIRDQLDAEHDRAAGA